MKKKGKNINFMDADERELIESIENSEWKKSPAKELKKRKKVLSSAAKNFMKKSERINIRITPQDLRGIKISAARDGLPYQTLISSLITRYNNGTLHLN